MKRVLEMFAAHGVHGTFFILGWIARRFPSLVREVADAGHEIACHSNWHRLVYELGPEKFRQDTLDAKAILEDVCGQSPIAYRAPSYSVRSDSLWALDILAEAGFLYDSSIYPIVHDRYGIPGFSRHATLIPTPSGPILEIPVATASLSPKRVVPVGGGAYLRLFPYLYTSAGIRHVNLVEKQPACIYFHPWEIDPEQPRLATAWLSRIRTYTGLSRMEAKLHSLLSEFRFSTLTSVYPQERFFSAVAPQRPVRNL